MDWGKVLGATGRAKVGIKIYNEKQYNEVKRFLDPEEATPPQQTGKFSPGKF